MSGEPLAAMLSIVTLLPEQWVLPELVKQNIGVLGMKSMGSGVILKSNTVSPIECLHYSMNLPVSVVITGIDSREILEQAFEAARTFAQERQLDPRLCRRLSDLIAIQLALNAGLAVTADDLAI